jgi:carbon dioxide concentrating mechanism protein CcmN
MSVLSLPTISHSQIYVSGDVIIDDTAAIAPGVILQATANGRIIIKAGACIGMGTVLTANQGTIEIGEGAVLGAGVLVVGSGKIGNHACIGAATTLIDSSVAVREEIAPGTLKGDTSRQESLSDNQPSTNHAPPERNGSHPPPHSDGTPPASTTSKAENNGSQVNGQPVDSTQPAAETNHQDQHSPPDSSSQQQSPTNSNTTIYGQTHIERLMVTLFPHKENFKQEKKDE